MKFFVVLMFVSTVAIAGEPPKSSIGKDKNLDQQQEESEQPAVKPDRSKKIEHRNCRIDKLTLSNGDQFGVDGATDKNLPATREIMDLLREKGYVLEPHPRPVSDRSGMSISIVTDTQHEGAPERQIETNEAGEELPGQGEGIFKRVGRFFRNLSHKAEFSVVANDQDTTRIKFVRSNSKDKLNLGEELNAAELLEKTEKEIAALKESHHDDRKEDRELKVEARNIRAGRVEADQGRITEISCRRTELAQILAHNELMLDALKIRRRMYKDILENSRKARGYHEVEVREVTPGLELASGDKSFRRRSVAERPHFVRDFAAKIPRCEVNENPVYKTVFRD